VFKSDMTWLRHGMNYHALRDEDVCKAAVAAVAAASLDDDTEEGDFASQSEAPCLSLDPGCLVASALDLFSEVDVADALRPTAAESTFPYTPTAPAAASQGCVL
jgi:hypothetical protein